MPITEPPTSTTPENTGVGDISLPAVVVLEPTAAQSNLQVAVDLMQGVRGLAAMPDTPFRAHALLCGFALETTLKAFLCLGGRNPKGHDLWFFWDEAVAQGLALGPMPEWAQHLAELHCDKEVDPLHPDGKLKSRYAIRYPEGLHHFGAPEAQLMTDGIGEVLKIVRVQVEL